MKDITANAILNLKEHPQTLKVNGSIMTYRDDDRIEISEANPQGINPSILLLDLKVINGSGPMKGVPKPFHYELSNEHIRGYSQVTIRCDEDESITVNVKTFG